MRGGLQNSARRFYARRANPTLFLWVKCEADQPTLSPLFLKTNLESKILVAKILVVNLYINLKIIL